VQRQLQLNELPLARIGRDAKAQQLLCVLPQPLIKCCYCCYSIHEHVLNMDCSLRGCCCELAAHQRSLRQPLGLRHMLQDLSCQRHRQVREGGVLLHSTIAGEVTPGQVSFLRGCERQNTAPALLEYLLHGSVCVCLFRRHNFKGFLYKISAF
jgi:hypothetical protein